MNAGYLLVRSPPERSLLGAAGDVLDGVAAIMVGAAPGDDIRDIRGPKPVASPWVVWALVGGGILLAVLAYVLWRWIKRRRKAPEKTDLEVALGRLEAARALMQPGGARDFSIEVSTDRARIHRAALSGDGGASHDSRIPA
jgi:hypothetical protein